MILSLLLAFQSFSSQPVHSVAPRIISHVQTTLPWTGHFAATNFKQTQTDRLRLSFAKKEIRETILALPKWHTDALNTLEIRNESNVSRGLSSAKKIILHTNSIESSDELKSVFIHEMGHIVDLGAITGKRGNRTNFKDGNTPVLSDDLSVKFYEISWKNTTNTKQNSKRTDFVSGYAQTDCFEDFAESYLFYRLHGENFRAAAQNSSLLQNKYNFLKQYVFGNTEFGLEKINVAIEPIFDATLLAINDIQPLSRR
jgi:hypothetical protein